ncbi:MAG TPA: hypothetical protein VIL09_11420 [Microvirga sp.]|jgi:uncharacterized phiE125 gp8 family phage protein
MHPILIDGPAVEPVTLPEMRAFLRLDTEAEDSLVAGLVKAARLLVEASSRRILVQQRWRLVLDRWPTGRHVHLPLSPLIAVERIRVKLSATEIVELAAAAFAAEAAADPPRIAVGADAPEPGVARGGILIDVSAGYGPAPDAVPEPLRLAIRLVAARWFENRGDVAGEQRLPPEALALVTPYRRLRL